MSRWGGVRRVIYGNGRPGPARLPWISEARLKGGRGAEP